MQALSLNVLHHQAYILLGINRFVQLTNVLMVQPALYPYLSNSLFLSLKVKQLRSVVLLYCNSFAACFVETFFDNSIRTTANLVTHVIADQI